MIKQAPSPARLFVICAFALSCFGLLLFLWNAFGGPAPLKPKGYRVELPVPDSTQLALQADVRVSGVTIGKVVAKRSDPRGNRTLATLELESRYAPVARDVRSILRQKTLLGETYVELTLGEPGSPPVPEGGRIADSRVTDHVELEDILNTFDERTRDAFRAWQRDGGTAVGDRASDINDALGNLPDFVESGDSLAGVLAANRGDLLRLVRDTGATFAAITRDTGQLQRLTASVDDVFGATASQRVALEQVVRRFPAFLGESRRALARLDRFAVSATPTVQRTATAMARLPGALDALATAAPDLERLLGRLEPLQGAGREGLPASARTIAALRPLLDELGPFLGELNPLLDWIGLHSHTLSDMLTNLGWGTAATAKSSDPRSPGHYSRQSTPTGAETVALWPRRLSSNRGNTHLNPLSLAGPEVAKTLIYPSSDCDNSGEKGADNSPACRVQPSLEFQGRKQGAFPHVEADGSR